MIGFGMGLAMAPATEAVMGSLPKDKAGVGSAVNDTTRQIGAALEVAILGSILSSSYGDRLVSHLPETAPDQPVPEVALGAIGGALAVAARLPGQAGASFADTAKAAFIHGMDATVAVRARVSPPWAPSSRCSSCHIARTGPNETGSTTSRSRHRRRR